MDKYVDIGYIYMQIDGQIIDMQNCRQMDKQIDGQIDRWTNRQMDKKIDG